MISTWQEEQRESRSDRPGTVNDSEVVSESCTRVLPDKKVSPSMIRVTGMVSQSGQHRSIDS